jgi:hypothetical protein
MFYELAAAGGGASFFHGLDESDIILQHAVNGFLDQLDGVLASPSCDFAGPDLFFGREMHFHATSIGVVA